jgi:hypothetical protein
LLRGLGSLQHCRLLLTLETTGDLTKLTLSLRCCEGPCRIASLGSLRRLGGLQLSRLLLGLKPASNLT